MKDSRILQSSAEHAQPKAGRRVQYLKNNWVYYALLIPVLAYFLIFCYVPMYGVLIAWKRYSPALGILGSEWVGWMYFEQFFSSVYFVRILKNTLLLSFYGILIGFPIPILFALLLNELRNKLFKSFVQTVSYLPHFISVVIICGMLMDFLNQDGVITMFLTFFGAEAKTWLNDPNAYRTIYIASDIWQSMGYSAIVYIAAIAGIDTQLYDAAEIDGCNTLKKMWHVTLPGIVPTITIMLILRIGSVLNVGAEKALLLYNPLTYETSDIISTFVYRYGMFNANYSYGTAVGLFNSIVNIVLLVSANLICKKTTETSLW